MNWSKCGSKRKTLNSIPAVLTEEVGFQVRSISEYMLPVEECQFFFSTQLLSDCYGLLVTCLDSPLKKNFFSITLFNHSNGKIYEKPCFVPYLFVRSHHRTFFIKFT